MLCKCTIVYINGSHLPRLAHGKHDFYEICKHLNSEIDSLGMFIMTYMYMPRNSSQQFLKIGVKHSHFSDASSIC